MKKSILKIRVYKRIFPNGKVMFESKDSEGGGYGSRDGMKFVVDMLKKDINDYLGTNRHGRVFIDFKPCHSMECGIDSDSNQYSEFFFPFSKREKMEFWKYYNQNQNQDQED